jgi:glycosyltransferase involved in cell wall biosynthesis
MDKLKKNNLLVLNYVMDETDKLLSHQLEVVDKIAKKINHVTVLTGKIGKVADLDNVNLYSYNWKEGKNLANLFKLLFQFYRIIRKENIKVVFSHMTFNQSLVILPFTKILRIKHFVWYAHKSKNRLLGICYKMFDGILTSTLDSCPVKSTKVYSIGQTINQSKFPVRKSINYPVRKLVHIGRFDPIKKIEVIISSVSELRKTYPQLTLSIIGSASGVKNQIYEDRVKLDSVKYINEEWLTFYPSVVRENILLVLSDHDCFIHACDAAIDKVILESTISKLPVITINQEYLKEFGSWGSSTDLPSINLEREFKSVTNLSKADLNEEVERRYLLAIEKHELSGWVGRLLNILGI